MKSILKFVSLAFAMFGMLFASCTKNDENTIVLIGEERYIDDILTVIPDTLKPTFDAIFGNIPEGPVPPKSKARMWLTRNSVSAPMWTIGL